MIITYFLPMISMCYTYSRVGLELWGSRAIGEATEAQAESIKSKRKVSKATRQNFAYLEAYALDLKKEKFLGTRKKI